MAYCGWGRLAIVPSVFHRLHLILCWLVVMGSRDLLSIVTRVGFCRTNKEQEERDEKEEENVIKNN